MNIHLCNNKRTQDIASLFTKTFTDSEGNGEGILISKLVEELLATTPEEDIHVFVAEEKGQITGCILFTRLTFASDKTAFLLSPVAVSTQNQGKGVGQRLIRFGLDVLKEKQVDLVFTYGDPSFYTKTGFERITEDQFNAPMPLSYPHGWLAQSLDGDELEPIPGKSKCVSAFENPELW